MTKHEWTSNIARDSYASYIGHPGLLSYMAVGMGECREVVRARMVEVCVFLFVTARGGRGYIGKWKRGCCHLDLCVTDM